MAHFAQIDDSGVVFQVIVVGNADNQDANGEENESSGIDFCRSLFGQDTQWVQTSYSGRFRKNYAGTGYQYDAERDAFIPPKPRDDAILDEVTCRWIIAPDQE